jgi:hypothetical protein
MLGKSFKQYSCLFIFHSNHVSLYPISIGKQVSITLSTYKKLNTLKIIFTFT